MKYIKLRDNIYAMVDDEDYGLVSQYKYFAQKSRYGTYYACRQHQKNCFIYHGYLHYDVLGTTPEEIRPLVVDHIDRNPLNCCKSNLRLCTRAQNVYNRGPVPNRSSKYKGVSYDPRRKKNRWRVKLCKEGKPYHVGYFPTEYRAVQMADVWAYRLFGRFAYLNYWTGPTKLCPHCGVFDEEKIDPAPPPEPPKGSKRSPISGR